MRGGTSIGDAQSAAEVAVAGDHPIGVIRGSGLLPKIASGTLKNESAGSDIPKPNAALHISVESTRRDVSKGQRGGPHDSHLADLVNQFDEVGQHGFQRFSVFSKPDRYDSFIEISA